MERRVGNDQAQAASISSSFRKKEMHVLARRTNERKRWAS